jgi:hypothetical protein
MPRGDGTGPMGTGSMTGRGAGVCAGLGATGFVSLGLGRARGGRRGRRNIFHATGLTGRQRAAMGASAPSAAGAAPTAEAEHQFLKTQVEMM